MGAEDAIAPEEQAQQPRAKGKQRARPPSGGSLAPPPAKRPRSAAASTGGVASVALVRADGKVLLTRETRSGKTLLNLPGGKAEADETLGETAAREAHEETGMQLTECTRNAIATIADWVECGSGQGHVGVHRLAFGSPDADVDKRFHAAAANTARSKTVQLGLEWHPLSDAHSPAWRAKHMHFPGQHRLAAAMRALGGSSGSSGSGGSSTLNLGDAVA